MRITMEEQDSSTNFYSDINLFDSNLFYIAKHKTKILFQMNIGSGIILKC
jgi:hypothetical protein